MIEWIKENSIAFTIALILHLLFIGALLFNWEFDKPKQIVLKQGDVIQTTAVDANSFNAKIAKIEEQKAQQKKAEQQRKAAEARKIAEARKKKELKEKKRREELKRKEEQKRKNAEAARKKEQQRKAAQLKEQKLKEQKLKEKKLKEKQLREKKLKEKKRKEAEKKAAEEKRKKEEARKRIEEKKRKEAEQKRKAEAEKKRQAELRRQQERERAERERLSRGIVKKYVALIAQKIERNWRQPLNAPPNLQCKIDIRLRSSGDVISVKIAESSGNASFDRSVETAVRRASPLPVPKDSVIFKEFEVMRLRFEPGSY